MKLVNRIMLNLLFSTVVFSSFANNKLKEAYDATINCIKDNKKEIGIGAGSAAVGALLMYLATNEKVKNCVGKTSSAVCNYTKAKCKAVANYIKNLSRGKKIAAAGAIVGTGAAAAYVYFDGPGVQQAKNAWNKNPATPPTKS